MYLVNSKGSRVRTLARQVEVRSFLMRKELRGGNEEGFVGEFVGVLGLRISREGGEG